MIVNEIQNNTFTLKDKIDNNINSNNDINITDATNLNKYVVQANTLIAAKQTLTILPAKLIRAAIKEIGFEDISMKGYLFTIKDCARVLNVDPKNLYKVIDEITTEISSSFVYFPTSKRNRKGEQDYTKIPWAKKCVYNSGLGVTIKLNDELAPYLLNLEKFYTQYPYVDIKAFKKVYAIRILEIILSKNFEDGIPINGFVTVININEIRTACNIENKYTEYSNLKLRVIDPAVKEINDKTFYTLTYKPIHKEGSKTIVAIEFKINLFYRSEDNKKITADKSKTKKKA